MHSEHDDTESSELELSDEEGVAEAPSATPSLDVPEDDGETTEVDEGELSALQTTTKMKMKKTSFSTQLCSSLARSVMMTKPV